MTELELIAAALATGAGTGITEITSGAIRDSYARLRDALRRRLASRGERAIQALESEETEPAAWLANLGEDLTAVGADHDEAVLSAARELLTLLDPIGARAGKYSLDLRMAKGVQVGDHNVQTNTFS